jgi:hypothetical protein
LGCGHVRKYLCAGKAQILVDHLNYAAFCVLSCCI